MSSPTPAHQPQPQSDPALYESLNVHNVYSQIAPHFSQTRHKPWPLVSNFLLSQPPGSLGLDIGCGNGKYLDVNPAVYLLGSDRSPELIRLALEEGADRKSAVDGSKARGREVCVADGLALPFPAGRADFVISVAVVHHFSTRERRVEAVRRLLECVRGGGKVLVYVWALEQGSSRRGWDEGMEQDQLVPWVMRRNQPKKNKDRDRKEVEGEEGKEEKTFQRYYHLYRKGELEEDVVSAGGTVVDSGFERDNWWTVATRP
ncbi:tRNA methyltransferase, has a role in tRNA modification [Coniochaeta pulveracea]|uniref:tRNA methyltransferase, has a role in tRNA modification n=1 Tax=Coniochaeta pulveracea TaxID=177199 RepID=A0A420YGE3_9PEZI|nr:tRNA methyltransferase, has a role in tRNA modification [Coniochaeta pulveracea]